MEQLHSPCLVPRSSVRFDFLVTVSTSSCARPRLHTLQVFLHLFNSMQTQTSSFPF